MQSETNRTNLPDELIEGEVSQVVILRHETELEHCLWSAILTRRDSCGDTREFILCNSYKGHRFEQFTLSMREFETLRFAFERGVYGNS